MVAMKTKGREIDFVGELKLNVLHRDRPTAVVTFNPCTGLFMIPELAAFSIILTAIGPWPWPSEIESILSAIFRSLANFWSAAIGSAPGDRTKTRGVFSVESRKNGSKLDQFIFKILNNFEPNLNDPTKSNVGGSTKRRLFSSSTIKFKTAGTTLSGLIMSF